jgi:nucleotide-binding universal stress UspA family protein
MPIILACTDGSSYAPSVYDHSAWAARRLGARVHVLHLLDAHRENPVLADYTGTIGLNAQAHLMQELVEAEQALGRAAQAKGRIVLTAARQQLETAGLTDIVADQKHGSLLEGIAEFEGEAALVVLGKRGEAAAVDPHHLGGNLERVIRSCHHPVLVTPPAFEPIERMLIAFDGGPSARKAIEFAVASPLLKGIDCHLLTTGRVDDDARWFLGEAAEKLRVAGIDATTHALPGDPESVIAESVRTIGAQLLVMGAYGHSRIRQFIVGSTTTTMVRTCPVPVLLFR